MKELLYTKEKDYWLDVQLNTTECDKCGVDLDPMKSYPIKVKNEGYPMNLYSYVVHARINKYLS